jgi:Transposase DDE domain
VHNAGVAGDAATSGRIDPRQVAGLKRLRHLLPLLEPLRQVGCERDAAGNRELHFDQYVTLVLLYLFNPLIGSVRALQQAAAIDKVSEQLGVKRFSLGSFSESVRVFDPEKLKAVIGQLAGEMRPVNADPRLAEHLKGPLKLADGTVLDAIVTVAKAAWLPLQDGTAKHAWRLHVQFDFDTFLPEEVELSDARNSGESDEKNVLRKKLKAGCCYVTDRWFAQFVLFNQVNAIASSYVCRVKENSAFEITEERLLDEAALEAGVVRDAVVSLGLGSKPALRPDHPVRLVVVEAEPHAKRGGRRGKTAGPGNKGLVLLATNLLDAPAHVIALIYHHRWAIEVFFRFFKQVLGCRHLLSHKPEGVMIQVYCAVIACMLINLWTGKKPNKRTVEMLAFYFMGVASEKEVIEHLSRPDNTGVKLRAKDELWKKLGVE